MRSEKQIKQDERDFLMLRQAQAETKEWKRCAADYLEEADQLKKNQAFLLFQVQEMLNGLNTSDLDADGCRIILNDILERFGK